MVYALVVGAPPFETESVAATYERIAAGTFALPPSLSPQVGSMSRPCKGIVLTCPQAAAFLQALLAPGAAARPSTPALLHHPFMLLPTPPSLPRSALTLPPPPSSLATPSPLAVEELLQWVTITLEHAAASAAREEVVVAEAPPYLVDRWMDYSSRSPSSSSSSSSSYSARFAFSCFLADGAAALAFVDGGRLTRSRV